MRAAASGPSRVLRALCLLCIGVVGCGSTVEASSQGGLGDFLWTLPEGFDSPPVPADNPMSDAKVELGRHLFYERRLSANGTQSCGDCHRQALAFTDGRALAVGSTGQTSARSAMGLANTAYAASYTWASPLLRSLERQVLVPMFGETPVELGLSDHEAQMLKTLRDDATYQALFAAAYPEEGDRVSLQRVVQALACFERVLISGDSPYDRYRNGDAAALRPAAERGLALFETERLGCTHCHGGLYFTDSVVMADDDSDAGPDAEGALRFHNDALYDLDGEGAYPANNTGLLTFTGEPGDMGRFKAPSLRNVAVTAPYMHDGSLATLDDVIDHYARGGRTNNPYKSEHLTGFEVSARERADLLAFLEALTDETFLTDPRLADPWRHHATR